MLIAQRKFAPQFPWLENLVDSRKVRATALLRAIGFAETAASEPAAEPNLCRVWIDSDRPNGGTRAGLLPN